MAYGLNFVYYTKFLYKINQAGKQASKLTIYFKQAKQASSRCQKLPASKLRLLSLACLLITNSDIDGACLDGACTDRAYIGGAYADGAYTDGACTDGAYMDGACGDGACRDGACSCPLLEFP